MTAFDFRDLFVFELANNHQGNVEHGRRIIFQMAKIAQDYGIRAAIKLQFRDLDTFIPANPDLDPKHIKRFLETRLSWEQFEELVDETRKQGLITMCTPFDEYSVYRIECAGIEVIKIGSPSNQDWPLIERVERAGKPVIFSTGGLEIPQIDELVAFFESRRADFAIMHCVSIYPTLNVDMQLNQIDVLRRRYPGRVIGLSTHENPRFPSGIAVAVAKGARMFEKHVGWDLVNHAPNAYSANADQVRAWLGEYQEARLQCGGMQLNGVRIVTDAETEALQGLRRSVSGRREMDPYQRILATAASQVRGMLAEAKIALPPEFRLEFSHHEGIVRFPYVGATIIPIVNRAYCKKLIVMTPDQTHPSHAHKVKDETFHVLSGRLFMSIDGLEPRAMRAGDSVNISPMQYHNFWTTDGAIVEEISTTHIDGDSFYTDPLIAKIPRDQRKTIVEGWGPC
jgi:N-acetylneuraminate synthase